LNAAQLGGAKLAAFKIHPRTENPSKRGGGRSSGAKATREDEGHPGQGKRTIETSHQAPTPHHPPHNPQTKNSKVSSKKKNKKQGWGAARRAGSRLVGRCGGTGRPGQNPLGSSCMGDKGEGVDCPIPTADFLNGDFMGPVKALTSWGPPHGQPWNCTRDWNLQRGARKRGGWIFEIEAVKREKRPLAAPPTRGRGMGSTGEGSAGRQPCRQATIAPIGRPRTPGRQVKSR